MKLFKVERTDRWSYDDYDSFICSAENEDEASKLHPYSENYEYDETGVLRYSYGDKNIVTSSSAGGWLPTPDKTKLKITEIGQSNSDNKEVILASYNAG